MKMKAIAGIMLMLFIVVTLFGVVPVKPQWAGTIKIGVLGPMAWNVGQGIYEGAQLAAKQINDAGGVKVNYAGPGWTYSSTKQAWKLAIVLADTLRGQPDPTPATGTAAAMELVAAGVDFAIGGFRSEAVFGAREVFMDAKIPFIITGASTNELIDCAGDAFGTGSPCGACVRCYYNRYKFMFRNTPVNSTMLFYTIASFSKWLMIEKLMPIYGAPLKIAVISENLTWADVMNTYLTSNAFWNVVMGMAGYGGVSVVYSARISPVATDVSSELMSVETAGAQLLIHVLSGPVGLTFITQWHDLGVEALPVGINVVSQKSEFWGMTGGKCVYETILTASGTRTPITPIALAFWDAYVAEYGHAPIYTSYGAYDTVRAIKEMIETVNKWPMGADEMVPHIEKTYRPLGMPAMMGTFKYTGPHPMSPAAYNATWLNGTHGALDVNPTMMGTLHDVFMTPADLGPEWYPPYYTRPFVVQWQAGRKEVVYPINMPFSKEYLIPDFQLKWKRAYPDYAPSGMPDFDQKQDAWWSPGLPPGQNWSWCGPTAVANSLWWMDSRFETSTTPPPTINDTFPLVQSYNLSVWDDHHPNNAPPLIEHLAWLMDTDGNRTGLPHTGTNVYDMEVGIAQYLSWSGVNPLGDVNGDGIVNMTDWKIVNASMGSTPGAWNWNLAADIWPETVTGPYTTDNVVNASDINLVTTNMGSVGMFYEHTVERPDFYYIEEEVERCQDVVLLLGFWYHGEEKDQYQEYCEVCEHVGPAYWASWQEFVPTANSLSRVEVQIARTLGEANQVPITMTIESPLGNVLTSKTLQWGEVPELPWCETVWVSFDVPNIPLTPGQSYYINLTTEGLAYHWCAANWDAYQPGISNFGASWDWTFRTFYDWWERDHGHYVTVAGVNSITMQIAFSDPCIDAFEAGAAPGRSPVPHPYPHNSTIHNNASLVSHDIYNVIYDPCPGGDWTIIGYPGEWLVQIEYAVITSPLALCGVNITKVLPLHCGTPVSAGYQIWTLQVNVTVHNNGTIPCNSTVNLYYLNGTTWVPLGTKNITNLPPCNTTTLTFNWNLTGLTICNSYTLKANATCCCGASDEFVDGQVHIRLWGDVDGNGAVNVIDVRKCVLAWSGIIVEPWADVDGNCIINVIDVRKTLLIWSGIL